MGGILTSRSMIRLVSSRSLLFSVSGMANGNAEGLRSARVKLQRAKDHITDLRMMKDGWIARKPYFLAIDNHPQPSKTLVKIHVREEIPEQFAAVLGDIIHNLRSTLDHLAWSLVLRNGGSGLTARQREILQLIAEGRSTKEIAADLGVSVKTVETHRAQLMERLDIHDIPGLVRFAIRAGLVSSDA